MDWNLLDGSYAYFPSDSTNANIMIIIRNPKKSSNTLARLVQLHRPCPQFRIHDLGQSHTARPSSGFGTLILTLANHDDASTTTTSSSYCNDRCRYHTNFNVSINLNPIPIPIPIPIPQPNHRIPGNKPAPLTPQSDDASPWPSQNWDSHSNWG
jgi:hypothetical protein